LSYGSEDGVACKLYHPFGFTETGDMDGNEIIAILEH
jgi:acetyltransferase, GNAT family